MRNVRFSFLYVGLLGVVVAAGLAGLDHSYATQPAFPLFQIGLSTAADLVALALDRMSRQSFVLPNWIVAAALVIALPCALLILGAPAWQVVVYSAVGFAAGCLIGVVGRVVHALGILLPLATLAALVGHQYRSWETLQVPALMLWQLVAVVGVPFLLLSALAPTAEAASSIRTSALVLVFAGVWVTPLLEVVRKNSGWHASWLSWIPGIAAAAVVLALSSRPAQRMLACTWMTPRMIYRFFPFVMRPVHTTGVFHLEERANEPDDYATAGHVTAWVYRQAGSVTHLVLAGHANPTVCKDVSAKMASAHLRLGEQRAGTFMVTGASLMQCALRPKRAPGSKASPSPLEDLVGQLKELKTITGMVEVREVTGMGYDRVCAEIRAPIERAIKAGKPVLLRRHKPDLPSRAVYVPFYLLDWGPLAPVSFDLDLGVFGPRFEELRRLHREEYYYEMVADAKRRRMIYEEWLERDMHTLRAMTHQMFSRISASMGRSSLGYLVDTYVDVLLGPRRRPVPWSPQQPLESRHVLMMRRSQELLEFIQRNESTTSPNGLPTPAGVLALRGIQEPEYPVSGVRNYADASVSDSDRIHMVSLQEQVEWNLPGLISSDKTWIERMDKILEDLDDSDPKRKKRLDDDSLQLLLDSFLRGWPSMFLSSKSQKERYEDWCAARRETVWREIHRQLMQRGLRMAPLQSENVVFGISTLGAQRVRVTPYYLTTDRSFMVLLHPRFGMTYYLNPWQHGQRVSTQHESAHAKRRAYRSCFQAGEGFLVKGDVQHALLNFRQALRTYPTTGTRELLDRFWADTCRDTSREFEDFAELAEAVVKFDETRPESLQCMRGFLRKYPDFLPDVYLYLGYSEDENASDILAAREELRMLNESYKAEIDSLVDQGILVPEETKSGEPTRYKVIGGRRRPIASSDLEAAVWGQPWDRAIRMHGAEAIFSVDPVEAEIESLNQFQQEIQQWGDAIAEMERALWDALRKHPNDNVKHAMQLDNTYVANVLRHARLMPSLQFGQLVAPLYGLRKGQAYLQVQQQMAQELYGDGDLIDRLKDRSPAVQAEILQQLRAVVETCLNNEVLGDEDKQPAKKLADFLETVNQADAIMRESIIRHQFRELMRECVRRAYKYFDRAAYTVKGITEVRRWLVHSQGLVNSYLNAYTTILGDGKVSVYNGLPNAGIEVLSARPAAIEAVEYDRATHTVHVLSETGERIPVVRFAGLTDLEDRHLDLEFGRPKYPLALKGLRLSPAYSVLLTPIQVPPRAQHWRQVMIALRPWLIQAFAHLSVLAQPEAEQEEFPAAYDDCPVIEQVIVDPEAICSRFLSEVDVDQEVAVRDV